MKKRAIEFKVNINRIVVKRKGLTQMKKNRILFICLGVAYLIIGILYIYLVKYGLVCERVHINDVDKGRDIIADEETARKIAYALVEGKLGFEESKKYQTEVSFNQRTNEWEVFFHQMTPEGAFVLDAGGVIRIERDSGIVTEIIWNLRQLEDIICEN